MHPQNVSMCNASILFTFNLQTKFDMFCFGRSERMAWAPKCRIESRDPDHAPFRDDLLPAACCDLLLQTKFKVSLTAPVTKI